MSRKIVVMILIGLICLGAVRVYNSPDENSKYEYDLQGTIEAGRSFSWLLFIGYYKGELLDQFDFTNEARLKLEKADLQQLAKIEILDKYTDGGRKYDLALWFIQPKPQEIELVALERRQDYIAMTFTCKDQFEKKIPDIPSKGRMLSLVVFRYSRPRDHALWKKVLRKTANAVPFCSSFGTTGRWIVFDYGYTYNLADYAIWYLRENENSDALYGLITKEEVNAFIDRLDMEKAISDAWASAWVKRHLEYIDESLFQKTEKLQNELVPKSAQQ